MITSSQIMIALCALDLEIGENDFLRKDSPIELVVFGGAISVWVHRNRHTTGSVDIVFSPDAGHQRTPIIALSYKVAEARHLSPIWLSDAISQRIVPPPKAASVFDGAKRQNIAFYRGTHLIVYEADQHFCLEQKLRQIKRSSGEKRATYIDDAIYMVNTLKKPDRPLSWERVRKLNRLSLPESIKDSTLAFVELSYETQFKRQGIVSMVFDEEKSRFKYQGLEGQWACPNNGSTVGIPKEKPEYGRKPDPPVEKATLGWSSSTTLGGFTTRIESNLMDRPESSKAGTSESLPLPEPAAQGPLRKGESVRGIDPRGSPQSPKRKSESLSVSKPPWKPEPPGRPESLRKPECFKGSSEPMRKAETPKGLSKQIRKPASIRKPEPLRRPEQAQRSQGAKSESRTGSESSRGSSDYVRKSGGAKYEVQRNRR